MFQNGLDRKDAIFVIVPLALHPSFVRKTVATKILLADTFVAFKNNYFLFAVFFIVASSMFKVAGSLQSKQKAGLSETTTRLFIPDERSNSTQDFTTSTR